MVFRGALAFLILAMAAGSPGAHAQEIYKTDQGHTEVLFGWRHAGVSMQHGEFTKAEGILTLDRDNLENSSIEVTIDLSSVSTGVEALDRELVSRKWFFADEYPEAHFKSTSIELTGDDTANVTGDLTLRGVTKPMVLETKLTFQGTHPVSQYISYYKGQWVAFHATAKINHQAFRVGAYSTGPIYVDIHTELKRQ